MCSVSDYPTVMVTIATGCIVNGTTGEGLSLTVEERKLVAKEWVQVAKDKSVIIIIVTVTITTL